MFSYFPLKGHCFKPFLQCCLHSMDVDAFHEYHRDRIGVWGTQVKAYRDQLDNYEYFDSVDGAEAEVEEIADEIVTLYDVLPDVQESAYESFLSLLDMEKKLSNMQHPDLDWEYEHMPGSVDEQEQLRNSIDTLKTRYREFEELQEEAYDQTLELFGPHPTQLPSMEKEVHVTEPPVDEQSVPVENGRLKADMLVNMTDADREAAEQYWEETKTLLSDPYVKSAGTVIASVGAALLGERLYKKYRQD